MKYDKADGDREHVVTGVWIQHEWVVLVAQEAYSIHEDVYVHFKSNIVLIIYDMEGQ